MAVENGVQNAELGYLLFPFEQYSNLAGKPLVGGHMEIYEAGTDTKYISYQNWDGAENPFRIPIPNDGRITVLADPTKTFDCYLYDSYNNLVCSRLNVQANVPGNISIKGADTILKNTDGTLDIYLRTLGNNVREYTVNTHNKVLDVQEPLYFVENSNTATVIGFSGDNYASKDYVNDVVTSSISGKMDVSKLEYNEDGEISAYDGSAFAGQSGAGDPEVNDLVHSNSATWNDVSAKLDTTAFSTVSGNFLTAIPDEYATKDYVQSSVSSKLDSTAFSTVSGSFLTAHQSLDDYLTKVSADGLYYPLNSNPSGYLTAHQSLEGYLTKASADTLYQPTGDYATHDDLTAYATTALVSSVSSELYSAFSGLSGDYELVAGSGVELVDDPNAKTTTINVTAEGTPVTAIEQMIESATSGLQPSGNYYSASNPSGFITGVDLTPYQTKADMTGYQPVGDYASSTDLANYQPVSSMTAYQEAGDYYSASNPSGFISNDDMLPISAGSNIDITKTNDTVVISMTGDFATTGDLVGAVYESAFGYDSNNKISGYNGSAFASEGGGAFPQSASEAVEYVTATSGDIDSTIDNVSANSGVWGGSALPISAGPGIKLDIVNDTLVFSNDETVLWSGELSIGQTATLTEPYTAFRKIELKYLNWTTAQNGQISYEQFGTELPIWHTLNSWLHGSNKAIFIGSCSAVDNTHITLYSACYNNITAANNWSNASANYRLYEVRGINRIAGGN